MTKSKTNTTKTTQTAADYVADFRKTMTAAIKTRLQTAKDAQARFDAHGDTEDSKLVSASKTHAKCAEQLYNLSDGAIEWCFRNNLSAVKIEAGSREFKLRLAHVARAMDAQSQVKDKPLDAVLTYLVNKHPKTLNYHKIMGLTGHKTPTQANYMKTFFTELGAVLSIAGKGIETSMTLDYDNPAFASVATGYQPKK